MAHIHGGEATEGAVDDCIRHAITKMSHLHFASATEYAARIVQMGENPSRVFTVGAPGLDNIRRLALPNRGELEAALGLALTGPVVLVTYHPVTLDPVESQAGITALIAALNSCPKATIIITGSNADPGHGEVDAAIAGFMAINGHRAVCRASLGQRLYLAAMREAHVVMGNSSSGVIEAPAFRVPTIDIGSRQKGRLKAPSVIECAPDGEAVTAALSRVLDQSFRANLPQSWSLLGDGHASSRIKAILKDVALDGLLVKSFYSECRE